MTCDPNNSFALPEGLLLSVRRCSAWPHHIHSCPALLLYSDLSTVVRMWPGAWGSVLAMRSIVLEGNITDPGLELLIAFPTSTCFACPQTSRATGVFAPKTTPTHRILPGPTQPTAFTREMSGTPQTTPPATPPAHSDPERLSISPVPQKKTSIGSVFSWCADLFCKYPLLSAVTLYVTLTGVTAGVAYQYYNQDMLSVWDDIKYSGNGVSFLTHPRWV